MEEGEGGRGAPARTRQSPGTGRPCHRPCSTWSNSPSALHSAHRAEASVPGHPCRRPWGRCRSLPPHQDPLGRTHNDMSAAVRHSHLLGLCLRWPEEWQQSTACSPRGIISTIHCVEPAKGSAAPENSRSAFPLPTSAASRVRAKSRGYLCAGERAQLRCWAQTQLQHLRP